MTNINGPTFISRVHIFYRGFVEENSIRLAARIVVFRHSFGHVKPEVASWKCFCVFDLHLNFTTGLAKHRQLKSCPGLFRRTGSPGLVVMGGSFHENFLPASFLCESRTGCAGVPATVCQIY